MPVLSFPSIQILGISVIDLISDSDNLAGHEKHQEPRTPRRP